MGNCIKCGLCAKVCSRAITLTESGPKIDLEKCNACGHCVAVCPVDAIDNPKSPRQREVFVPSYEDAAAFLRTPRSVRFYREELIPRDKLLKLIDIGRYPQTGSNSQGISYIVVEGREKIRNILEVFCKAADEFCPKNPDLGWIAGCVERYRESGVDGVLRDCTALIFALSKKYDHRGRENAQFSLTFMALAAPSLGLGTCWAGIFERLACHAEYAEPIAEAIGLPSDKCIQGVLMAGIPDIEFRRVVERDPLDLTII